MKKNFLNMLISLLILSVLLPSFAIAGPNENAGIVFDLDASTYGNQNQTSISSQPAGTYIRLDVYCTGVQNLDTYEFQIIYDETELAYVAASATNPITYEPNILTINGGTAIGWMIDTSSPGILSIAYTLAGTDTLEAPEGEGLIADIVFQSLVETHSILSFGNVVFIDSFGEDDVITHKHAAGLYENGNVNGTIKDSNNNSPIEGAIVSIDDFTDSTDTDGTYLLECITIGSHEITCFANGYSDSVSVVEVLVNQTVTVDFNLNPFDSGTIDGTVTNANNGEPIENALITATNQGEGEYTGYTDGYGYYEISNLTVSQIVGDYTITSDAGVPFTMGEVTNVQILENQTTTIDFALTSPIMTAEPLGIFPTVNIMGDSVITEITLSNIGTEPFNWNASLENPEAKGLDFITNRFEGVTLPSMNADVYPHQTTRNNQPSKDTGDLLFDYDVDTPSGLTGLAGAEFGNGYFYAAKWSGAEIAKFDVEGNWIENFTIPGVSGLRDLAFDGEYFYGGQAAYTIYKMDFAAHTLVGTISSPYAVRSIAYDSGNDGFWVHDWYGDFNLINRSGNVIGTIPCVWPTNIYSYGSAYDNVSEGGPYLWIFSGASAGGGCQFFQYDLNTLLITDVILPVSIDFPSTTSGGMFASGDIVPGKWVMGGIAQGDPDILFGYEICPYIKGFSFEPTSGTIEPGCQETVQTKLHWLEGTFPGLVASIDMIFAPDPDCGQQTVNVHATFGESSPGSISGLITLESTPYGSHNVEDVFLTATSQIFPSIYYIAYPDSTGEYTIQDIYPGNYSVTAILESYEDSTIFDVEVEEATNTPNVDFELNCLLGALQGTVEDYSGVPIEDANISLVGDLDPSETYCATTNESGYYEVDQIIAQPYHYTCTAVGFLTVADTLTIHAGETYVEDIILGTPEMRVEPNSVEVTLAPDNQTTRPITVYNDGSAPLEWSSSIENLEVDFSTNRFTGGTEPSMHADVCPHQTISYNPPAKDMWDILFSYDVRAQSGGVGIAGAGFGNGYFLVAEWGYQSRNVFKFDVNGNYISSWVPTWMPGTAGLRDMAFDGEYFYASNAGTTIYQFDEDGNNYGTINSPVDVRSIAYDSDSDAFWVNNWGETLTLISRTGSVLKTIASPPMLYGSAYDNISAGGPYLWIFTGTASGSGCQIEQYDLNTLTLTGVSHSVSGDIANGISGGLFISDDIVFGKVVIGGVVQTIPDMLFGYELCNSGAWIAIEPISGSVLPGESQQVTATFDTANKTIGEEFDANIHFIPNVGDENIVSAQLVVGNSITGTFNGTVTEFGTSLPVEGVLVTASLSKVSTYTNSAGYYVFEELGIGTYSVTFEKEGYNTGLIENVEISEGNTTTVNIDLTQPAMDITPTSISATVPLDEPLAVDIHIVNNGDGELAWDASIILPERDIIHIPASDGDFPRSDDPISLLIDPSPNGTTVSSNPTQNRGSIAWGMDATNSKLISLDVDNPSVFTNIATVTSSYFAGDFPAGVFDYAYVIDYPTNNFGTLDIATGIFTQIGTLLCSGNNIWTDISRDPSDGTLYGVQTDGNSSNLYIIDPVACIATLVGPIGFNTVISLATDRSDGMWAVDITNDVLVSIDKSTGLGTGIGPLGFDANYAQSATWDPSSNNVYLASYGTIGELRIADTSTGNTTVVGPLGSTGVEVTWFGIPGYATIPWIVLEKGFGTVAAGGDSLVTVYFNTIDHTVGEILQASLEFVSTPDVGSISIPVTIIVGDIGVGDEPSNLENKLFGNFPNPFSAATTIKFSLKEPTHVTLSVYNVKGQLVDRLFDNDLPAGADHEVVWNETDSGKKLANGIYFYNLQIGEKEFIRKMILMK